MIDEDDVPQAIFDYATTNYGKHSRELFEKYLEEFELGFFWEKQSHMSTIGELRQKGLLFVGKMGFGDRNYKIAFIPIEIRDDLKDLLVVT